jgi:hypothetical protein
MEMVLREVIDQLGKNILAGGARNGKASLRWKRPVSWPV